MLLCPLRAADVDVLEEECRGASGLIFGVFFLGIFIPRFLIEFIKNNQVAFEADMTLNMGQWLSVPFILAGLFLVIWAMKHPKIHIDFPDKFPDESPRK